MGQCNHRRGSTSHFASERSPQLSIDREWRVIARLRALASAAVTDVNWTGSGCASLQIRATPTGRGPGGVLADTNCFGNGSPQDTRLVELPAAGTYYLALNPANDQAGSARLSVSRRG